MMRLKPISILGERIAQPDRYPFQHSDYRITKNAQHHEAIAATQRHWQARLHSRYLERDENRRLGTAGHVKSEEVDVTRMILVNDVPFEQLVERNGPKGSSYRGAAPVTPFVICLRNDDLFPRLNP
jgi:hypothetical protein